MHMSQQKKIQALLSYSLLRYTTTVPIKLWNVEESMCTYKKLQLESYRRVFIFHNFMGPTVSYILFCYSFSDLRSHFSYSSKVTWFLIQSIMVFFRRIIKFEIQTILFSSHWIMDNDH